MALKVEVEDSKFRVVTQEFQTGWFPNTPANRKVVVIILRSMLDGMGNPLFTYQELAAILGSDNPQASSQHVEGFRDCGEKFDAALRGKERKVDKEVVDAVIAILKKNSLGKDEEMARRVNEYLGREDINASNIRAALEQISALEIRKILNKQLVEGKAHYKEEYLIEQLFELVSQKAHEEEPAGGLSEESMELEIATPARACGQEELERAKPEEPEDVKKLFEGEVNHENLLGIWNSPVGWKIWAFILYFQGISQSVIVYYRSPSQNPLQRFLLCAIMREPSLKVYHRV